MRGVVRWNGPLIAERIQAAAKLAIDETTREAAADARQSHWWQNRGEQLEEEIVAEAATVRGPVVSGKFGTTERRGFYGYFLERRTPFLRPAADRVFPRVAGRLRERP